MDGEARKARPQSPRAGNRSRRGRLDASTLARDAFSLIETIKHPGLYGVVLPSKFQPTSAWSLPVSAGDAGSSSGSRPFEVSNGRLLALLSVQGYTVLLAQIR